MRLCIGTLLALVAGAPAAAQVVDHSNHAMHGETAPPPAAPDPHAGHAGHAGHGAAPAGAASPVGRAPAPAVASDHAADRYFPAADMARARAVLRSEHGGARYSRWRVSLAEFAAKAGDDGYRWEGDAFIGDDINRLVLQTEGEGAVRRGIEEAEAQVLYSRAVTRYTDVQFGLRHDFEPGPATTYLTAGFETLLPYWIDAEGALFLSERGDLSARLHATHDLRITQKLILESRAEMNLAAQDVQETATGSGLTSGEAGLRLRYELRRDFAPYVGVSYERSFGRTADFARSAGDHVDSTSIVLGVRGWF